MIIELIPVIEISGEYLDSTVSPENGPYWEYAEKWERFHQELQSNAGYPELFESIETGSNFYTITNISKANLEHLVHRALADVLNGECEFKDIGAIEGGFVLKIDGHNAFFPQCCSDLSVIESWEKIANGVHENWFGHPMPKVIFENNQVILECLDDKIESFSHGTKERIVLEQNALKEAVAKTKLILKSFASEIDTIASDKYNFTESVGQKLVFGI